MTMGVWLDREGGTFATCSMQVQILSSPHRVCMVVCDGRRVDVGPPCAVAVAACFGVWPKAVHRRSMPS